MSYSVRISSPEDFDSINALGQWFQENSNFANCGWSPHKIMKMVLAGSDPYSNTFMEVCTLDGEVVGFFIGVLTDYFFSSRSIAQEQCVFFKLEHRTEVSTPLKQMMQDFEDWARARDAVETCIGITSGISGEGYPKFIQSQGYKKAGLIFKKEV